MCLIKNFLSQFKILWYHKPLSKPHNSMSVDGETFGFAFLHVIMNFHTFFIPLSFLHLIEESGSYRKIGVTPSFKDKTECNPHVCQDQFITHGRCQVYIIITVFKNNLTNMLKIIQISEYLMIAEINNV